MEDRGGRTYERAAAAALVLMSGSSAVMLSIFFLRPEYEAVWFFVGLWVLVLIGAAVAAVIRACHGRAFGSLRVAGIIFAAHGLLVMGWMDLCDVCFMRGVFLFHDSLAAGCQRSARPPK